MQSNSDSICTPELENSEATQPLTRDVLILAETEKGSNNNTCDGRNMNRHIHIHIHIRIRIHIHTHTHIHAYIHACMHASIHTYIHFRIFISIFPSRFSHSTTMSRRNLGKPRRAEVSGQGQARSRRVHILGRACNQRRNPEPKDHDVKPNALRET